MGVAYRGLGLGFTPAVLFSLVVYSATAQAVTLGLWALPPPIAAMAVACVATNARYLVMGAHLRQLFPDVPRRVMLPILFLLADASWLMTVAEAERGRRDAGYLLGSSLPMAIGWIGGTALGYALPLKPHGPLAVAAAFLPLAFVAALLPTQWRGWRSLLPWSASAAIGLTVASTLGQSWTMLIGGGVGTLVSALSGDDA
jgi:predicted branched-subunit amino acid permease